MSTKKFIVCLGFVVSLVVTCISQSTWAVGPRLAYSKKLGVEIFAELEEDQWCQSVVSIQVKSENPSFYNSDKFAELFAKLGRIIEQECKEAAIANIVGTSGSDHSKSIYSGYAEKIDGWLIKEKSIKQPVPPLVRKENPVNSSVLSVETSDGEKQLAEINEKKAKTEIELLELKLKLSENQRKQSEVKGDIEKVTDEQKALVRELRAICGGRICAESKEGKFAYLSEDSMTWIYADGIPVPKELWPKDSSKWENIVKTSPVDNNQNRNTSQVNQAEQGQFEKAQAAYDAKDYFTAYSLFLPLAETGNASAQFKLGRMYDQELGVPKNDEKAAYWYRESATNGNRQAQYNYGVMLYHGRGVKEDKGQSVAWKEKAAEQGLLDAKIEVGLAYLFGEGVKSDEKKGCFWANKAAEIDAENMKVQTMLGVCYVEGHYVRKDVNRGFQLLESAGSKGSEFAILALTFAYLDGTYVISNQDKARRLLEDAAATGNQIAKSELKKFNLKNPSTQNADKYFINPEKANANLLWKSVSWDDQGAGVKIGLSSSNNSKSMFEVGCLFAEKKGNVYWIDFEILPYQLQSPYPYHIMNGELRFKSGEKINLPSIYVDLTTSRIAKYLNEYEARQVIDMLTKNDGNFSLHFTSPTSLKNEHEEKNAFQPKIFSILKEQRPLTVDAPSNAYGPIKNLVGVYRQACLGEENGKNKLKVISGWIYDAGDIAPNWQTPSLRYGPGTLQIDCMILGDKKGGYVDFRIEPYGYMSATSKTILFNYPNGKQYSFNAEVDRDSWSLKSKLDVDSLRTLVSEAVVNGGRFKIEWDNKYYAVDRTNGLPYLNDFLAACH